MFVPVWVLVVLGLVVALAVTGLWKPLAAGIAWAGSVAFAIASAPFILAWGLLSAVCSSAWWAVTHHREVFAPSTAPKLGATPRSDSAPPR